MTRSLPDQHLAKMEMRVLYEELLPRLKSVELAGKPTMSNALFVNGPKNLPVRSGSNSLRPAGV